MQTDTVPRIYGTSENSLQWTMKRNARICCINRAIIRLIAVTKIMKICFAGITKIVQVLIMSLACNGKQKGGVYNA